VGAHDRRGGYGDVTILLALTAAVASGQALAIYDGDGAIWCAEVPKLCAGTRAS
jgi:hypothetical protein